MVNICEVTSLYVKTQNKMELPFRNNFSTDRQTDRQQYWSQYTLITSLICVYVGGGGL